MADAPQAAETGARIQSHIDTLDTAMAGAMSEYADARKALAAHHGAADATVQTLQASVARRRPRVEAILKANTPLSESDTDCLREYMADCGKLGEALKGRRLAFGATRPVGDATPGKDLG